MGPANPLRRWQFGLGWLLVLVALSAVLLGWFVRDIHYRRAMRAIQVDVARLGGKLRFDDSRRRSVTFELTGPRASEDCLKYLHQLPNVRSITLTGERVGDSSLERLADAGDDLKYLHSLHLRRTQVSDAGLVHIHALPIRSLILSRNAIGYAGLGELQAMRALRNLTLHEVQLQDSDLVHFERLDQLETLNFFGTAISDAGLQRLRAELPNCQVTVHRIDRQHIKAQSGQ